jgi:hypothetical protein
MYQYCGEWCRYPECKHHHRKQCTPVWISDLHQLRGRVGRSNKKAFCYLLAPPMSTLPPDSRKIKHLRTNTVIGKWLPDSNERTLISVAQEICWVGDKVDLLRDRFECIKRYWTKQ